MYIRANPVNDNKRSRNDQKKMFKNTFQNRNVKTLKTTNETYLALPERAVKDFFFNREGFYPQRKTRRRRGGGGVRSPEKFYLQFTYSKSQQQSPLVAFLATTLLVYRYLQPGYDLLNSGQTLDENISNFNFESFASYY